MDKGLQFIQSCVRREINTDDLGYITKDYFNNSDDLDHFFKCIKDRIDSNFFDQPKTIGSILEYYYTIPSITTE